MIEEESKFEMVNIPMAIKTPNLECRSPKMSLFRGVEMNEDCGTSRRKANYVELAAKATKLITDKEILS